MATESPSQLVRLKCTKVLIVISLAGVSEIPSIVIDFRLLNVKNISASNSGLLIRCSS